MNRNGFSYLELFIVMLCMAIIATVAYPNVRRSIAAADEANAAIILKRIAGAEVLYHALSNSYADAATLTAKGLLPGLALPALQKNYIVNVTASADTWNAVAAPYDVDQNPRSFYIDQSLTLRFCDGCPANAGSAAYQH